MTDHTLQIANTVIQFQMDKTFTPDNPFGKTIQVRYQLNDFVFGFNYEPNHWDSYEETYKAIVSQMLNIMLSRAAWPSFHKEQHNGHQITGLCNRQGN